MYNLILYMHINSPFRHEEDFCFNYLKIGYDVFKHCF